MYIDSHSHLADSRIENTVHEILRKSVESGVTVWVQGGVGPEDWKRQIELAAKYPGVKTCFGLHPYWVSEHSEEECEIALDLLAKSMSGPVAMGEMGLDFRPQYIMQRDLQIDMFRNQLELAQSLAKPVVLHLVHSFEEALRVLDFIGVPKQGGVVHSFNAKLDAAEEYLKRGLYLSVGGPLLRPNNQRLKSSVLEIPMEKLLLESDTPDQAPAASGSSDPCMILEIAQEIANIKKLSQQEVLSICTENARNFFKV